MLCILHSFASGYGGLQSMASIVVAMASNLLAMTRVPKRLPHPFEVNGSHGESLLGEGGPDQFYVVRDLIWVCIEIGEPQLPVWSLFFFQRGSNLGTPQDETCSNMSCCRAQCFCQCGLELREVLGIDLGVTAQLHWAPSAHRHSPCRLLDSIN